MAKIHALSSLIVLSCGSFAFAGSAHANKIDTLTGQTPGVEIGCYYTFKNGDPPIPCASDFVGADGTVSFVKPNAPFDNVEYFTITADGDKKLLKLDTPLGTSINDVINDGDTFPVLTPDGTFDSFFDVFFTIDLAAWGGTVLPVGFTCNFADGISGTLGCEGLLIEAYTGDATVAGFDIVSSPEPTTLSVFGLGLAGLGFARHYMTKRRQRRQNVGGGRGV